MREEQLDLWDTPADAKCITTNGYIKTNGELVMGAGVAGQAQARYSWMPKHIGQWVQEKGNHVYNFGTAEQDFFTFPVKHVWYEDADLELIKRSAEELMEQIEYWGYKTVLLPRPGCGNGHLKWEDVKPVIESILDDRVVVIYA